MADPVGQQPGDSHSMHVFGEGKFIAAAEGASGAESPEQTLPALPPEHAIEVGKMQDTLPTGTVTLLFTDIARSTQLLQQAGEQYASILTTCRQLLRAAFQQ